MIGLVLGAVVGARVLGYRPLLVRTGSMGAAAPVGSVAVTKLIADDDVRPGSIIVLHRGGHPEGVLHRVISRVDHVDGPVVRTQGDANPVPDADPYTLPAQVLTPVVVVPHLGRLISAVATPLGGILLVLVPAALLLASSLTRLWRPTPPGAASGGVR